MCYVCEGDIFITLLYGIRGGSLDVFNRNKIADRKRLVAPNRRQKNLSNRTGSGHLGCDLQGVGVIILDRIIRATILARAERPYEIVPRHFGV